ncbi:hypothetical protein SEA_FORZA_78 [Gordonia phage Forza]|uniref:Uncharacterized protein n=1 Tax=Gordonia phage Forza TaxID=2571247 RepID=A0A650F0J6_9CAUD|nr:hypothetical protein PP303_gp078 [Gordonia phage Forza]QEM41547.1 hypothetical protein SEA_BOOPY_78 [Gordonia phage Boopy]QGT55071.1 hypothetical protein SEA_FORZA_78 [Gordonia phage Forza]UXE04221.1 hypothetical protein SEA_BLUENGOLD_77 [Gordonia phage BlueNGold]WBF03860.1 hypothetical protein SEA_MAREELIH_77 [Gordonia phage Mareelih]
METIAEGWKIALSDAHALTAAFKMNSGKFDEAKHPRGADGRFIHKGGWIKWIDPTTGLWNRGEIDSWTTGANKKTILKVKRPNGQFTSVSNDRAYGARSPVATIDNGWIDSNLKKIGGATGSNPGGLYEGLEDDTKYYIKETKSEKHAINELLGHKLYAAVGVATPDVGLTQDKKKFTSKIEDSVAWSDVPSEHKSDVLDEIRKNFVIDAWLANWDAPVTDNIRVNKDGVPLRVDTGGALDYRAQGASKISNLTPEVQELKTLRDPSINSSGHQLYGPTTKEQEEDGVKRILALSPDAIRELVKEEGGPNRLADDLIARRAWLATHYGFQLPEATNAGQKIIGDHELKTKGQDDIQPPSLAPAVKKLEPNEKPAIAVGSPVWLKNKKDYGKNIPDVWTVESIKPGGQYQLKGKGNAWANYVEPDDVEVLRSNHTLYGANYADGTVPSTGDSVELSTGEVGEVVEFYPKYAKIQLTGPDGSSGKTKTIAIKKLNPVKLPDYDPEPEPEPEPESPKKVAKKAAKKAMPKKPGGALYNYGYDPVNAEIQQKYRKAAFANIADGKSYEQAMSGHNLIPTQPLETSNGIGTGSGPKDMLPVVVKVGNKKYLVDGHHRYVKAGNKPLVAHVVDFDSPLGDVTQPEKEPVPSGLADWEKELLGQALETKDPVPTTPTNWGNHDWNETPNPTVILEDGTKATVDFYSPGMPFAVVKHVLPSGKFAADYIPIEKLIRMNGGMT